MLGTFLRRRIRSKKGRERARKRFIFSVIFLGSALLVLFGIAIYFLHNDRVVIQNILVRGATTLPGSEVKRTTEKYLDGAYLYLFPKKSVFLYPKSQIANALLSDFARIEKVSVKAEDLQTLTVTISERELYALWCGTSQNIIDKDVLEEKTVTKDEVEDNKKEEVKEEVGEQCFILDKHGIIYAHAPSTFQQLNIVFEGAFEGDNPIGTQFLTQDEFENITELLSEIENMTLSPKKVLIIDERDFSVVLKEKTQLKFRRGDDFSLVLIRLEASFISGEIDKDRLADVEYIDLRFGNRLYVKDRG